MLEKVSPTILLLFLRGKRDHQRWNYRNARSLRFLTGKNVLPVPQIYAKKLPFEFSINQPKDRRKGLSTENIRVYPISLNKLYFAFESNASPDLYFALIRKCFMFFSFLFFCFYYFYLLLSLSSIQKKNLKNIYLNGREKE